MNIRRETFRPGPGKPPAGSAFRSRRNRNSVATRRPERLTFRQHLIKYTVFLLIFLAAAGSGWLFMSSLEQAPPSQAWRACLIELPDGAMHPEMTVIPADRYALSDNRSAIAPFLKPQRLSEVVIDRPFLIQNQKISRALFEEYVDFVEKLPDPNERERLETRMGVTWKSEENNATLIQGISWEAAWDFSNWLSQRTGCRYEVPSREEWAAAVIHLHSQRTGDVDIRNDAGQLRSLLWENREWTRSECPMGHYLVGAEEWIGQESAGQEVCMPSLFAVAGFRMVLTPSAAAHAAPAGNSGKAP